MRIAVVGAGIVGVTTAFELAEAGHEVTVLERRAAVATQASFANAGVVAPGYVTPWAAPGMPWKVISHLASRHAPVRLGRGAFAQLPWIWRWWRACRPEVHGRNRGAMYGLARFSRERLDALTASLGLEYEQAGGLMVLLRGARDLEMARTGLKLLESLGVGHEVVDAEHARRLEPGLHPQTTLHAAIHLPQDGVGNCRQFAHLLKREAERRGARFLFDHDVRRIAPGASPRVDVVRNGDAGLAQTLAVDAVVVCAGVCAPALLHPVGVRLPVVPVHGYSLTAPLRQLEACPEAGPRGALIDERYKVAISRLGQRVRVAGSAELGGRDGVFDEAAMRTLYRVLDDWFPGVAQLSQAQRWKGARPMLPDGPPVLGSSGAPGVWLNLGHGSSGWALACGSAAVLAALIGGRPAPVDATVFGIDRLR